jgi:hypothetical protein
LYECALLFIECSTFYVEIAHILETFGNLILNQFQLEYILHITMHVVCFCKNQFELQAACAFEALHLRMTIYSLKK